MLPRADTAATVFDRDRRRHDTPEGHSLGDDDDDEELVFDYFNFNDASPAFDKPLRRRQFHRSAATLPTVPSWSDDVEETAASSRSRTAVAASAKKTMERRGLVNQSQQQKLQQQQQQQLQRRQAVPSYVDPFSRQRMITARRDDVLYTTHSAWQLDEI